MGLRDKLTAETVVVTITLVLVGACVVLTVEVEDHPSLWQTLVSKIKASRSVSSAELAELPAMQLLAREGVPRYLVGDYIRNGDHYTVNCPLHPASGGDQLVVEVGEVPHATSNKAFSRVATATHRPASPQMMYVERVSYEVVARRSSPNIVAGRITLRHLPDSARHTVLDLGTITVNGTVNVPGPGVNTYYERDFSKKRDHIKVFVVSEHEMEALEELRAFCRTRKCDMRETSEEPTMPAEGG